MKLKIKSFDKRQDLVDFVNEMCIRPKNIQHIQITMSYVELFYWEEDVP